MLGSACCDPQGPLQSEDWSTPFSEFDVIAGFYAGAYDIEGNEEWLVSAMEALQSSSLDREAVVLEDSPSIGSLRFAADQVTGRYGVDSLYHGVPGYWLEMCQYWGDLDDFVQVYNSGNFESSLDWFVQTLHQPCSQASSSPVTVLEGGVDCAVIGTLDPISNSFSGCLLYTSPSPRDS